MPVLNGFKKWEMRIGSGKPNDGVLCSSLPPMNIGGLQQSAFSSVLCSMANEEMPHYRDVGNMFYWSSDPAGDYERFPMAADTIDDDDLEDTSEQDEAWEYYYAMRSRILYLGYWHYHGRDVFLNHPGGEEMNYFSQFPSSSVWGELYGWNPPGAPVEDSMIADTPPVRLHRPSTRGIQSGIPTSGLASSNRETTSALYRMILNVEPSSS